MYVMIVLKGSVPMSFGGTEQPAMYGELVSISGLNPDTNKKLSATITAILKTKQFRSTVKLGNGKSFSTLESGFASIRPMRFQNLMQTLDFHYQALANGVAQHAEQRREEIEKEKMEKASAATAPS
ncbi:hypothetical protein REPUB_Repub03eG0185700 [Reevesia pubescens]